MKKDIKDHNYFRDNKTSMFNEDCRHRFKVFYEMSAIVEEIVAAPEIIRTCPIEDTSKITCLEFVDMERIRMINRLSTELYKLSISAVENQRKAHSG